MTLRRFFGFAATFGALLVGATAVPGSATAQDLDAEAWVDLAQMPVAVARLEVAGVPDQALGLLVDALNRPDVTPTRFLETVWAIPVLWGDDANAWAGTGDEGMGGYVQSMHARGLRGPELADAIHAELNRRGVPAGEGRRDALDPDYLPDDWVDGRFRDDPLFEPDDPRADRRSRGRLFRDRGGRDGNPGSTPPAVQSEDERAGKATPPGLEGRSRPGTRGGPAGRSGAGPGEKGGGGPPAGGGGNARAGGRGEGGGPPAGNHPARGNGGGGSDNGRADGNGGGNGSGGGT